MYNFLAASNKFLKYICMHVWYISRGIIAFSGLEQTRRLSSLYDLKNYPRFSNNKISKSPYVKSQRCCSKHLALLLRRSQQLYNYLTIYVASLILCLLDTNPSVSADTMWILRWRTVSRKFFIQKIKSHKPIVR